MNLADVLSNAVEPALRLLPPHMDSPKARVMMLAIGLQESRFRHRKQLGGGPANSFWQMERRGGVAGVCRHPMSRDLMRKVCTALDCEFDITAVWERLATDDVLGAAAARLLLWTDAAPLPEIGQAQQAWDYYQRVWRPGKPHPETWHALYAQALDAVQPPPEGNP